MWNQADAFITLADYRVMIVRSDETVAEFRRLDARDDIEAIAMAQAIGGEHAVELWDGMRFIELFQERIGL